MNRSYIGTCVLFIAGLGCLVNACGPIDESVVQPKEATELVATDTESAVVSSNAPDLIVNQIVGPFSVLPNAAFGLDVRVCNRGRYPAPSGLVKTFLSVDRTITLADAEVGMANYPALPGASLVPRCVSVRVPSMAGVPDGSWIVGAIVDPADAQPETLETNNSYSTPRALSVGTAPDLISGGFASPPPAVLPGGAFQLDAYVCNFGTVAASGVPVAIVLSTDFIITAADTTIAVETIYGPIIASGIGSGQGCAVFTANALANVPPGTYYVGAIIDPANQIAELREDNNTIADSRRIIVDEMPDFRVERIDFTGFTADWQIDVSFTVCNRGSVAAPTNVDVILSLDSVISPADPLGVRVPFSTLAPGACAYQRIAFAPTVPPGFWWLGAYADGEGAVRELIETNNSARVGQISTVQPTVDLIVQSVSAAINTQGPGLVDLTATVCNIGTTASSGVNVEALVSSSPTTQPDVIIASNSISEGLVPGECRTVLMIGSLSGFLAGTYTTGAVIDRFNLVTEIDELNNITTGNSISYAP